MAHVYSTEWLIELAIEELSAKQFHNLHILAEQISGTGNSFFEAMHVLLCEAGKDIAYSDVPF